MASPLTPEEYVLIKDAIVEGKSRRWIVDQFGRSSETVRRIEQSESFEGHVEYMKEVGRRFRAKRRLQEEQIGIAKVPEKVATEQKASDIISELRKEQAEIYQQFEDIIQTLVKLRR